MNAAMVNSVSFLMASLTLPATKASQHDAYLVWALGSLEIIYLVWKPKSSQAKWKEKTANFFNTLPWTKAEVKDICHTLLDLEWRGVGFLDLVMVLRVVWECNCNIKHQLMLETSYLVMETHANSTLSKCMLLACAYQSARQRNMGITKKSCQGVWQLFGKGRLLGKPIFKQTLRNYQPLRVHPKQLLNNTKNVSIKKTLSLTTHAQNSILQLWRKIPRTTMTSTVVYSGKHAMERNAWTFVLWTWGGMTLKGICLNFWNLKPT